MWTLGKREPSWKPGELGDPAPPWEGEKTGSWYQTVEEDRHHKMPRKLGDGLATTPSHVYAQSMYCSVSRWRPQKVDKRMVLEYTHGLFIT